ncbi:hypothetical protein [Priestia aryabhattai]|uniref:Uncharacterized protein n=1 Tax=Priestia aryabhattai TaxID=412384 RepID=A0ABD7WU36_PRIAR|nr:hypothetical protein [Priestia aryabhattai]WEA43821.1 hypothetical protein PWO00_23800 [Priestia aryabhattai]
MNKKNVALASIMGIGFLGVAVYSFNQPTEQAEAKDSQSHSTEIYTQQDKGAIRSKVVGDYISENHEVPTDEQLEDMKVTPNQFVKNSLETYSKNSTQSVGVNDKAYNMYLHAKEISSDIQLLNEENTIGQNADMKNLFVLTTMVQHFQFVRTSHIDPNGNAVEKTQYADQWEQPSEPMIQADKYIKEILHDLDVANNKGGKGKTYGVTHRLDGDKVDELEAFLNGEESSE